MCFGGVSYYSLVYIECERKLVLGLNLGLYWLLYGFFNIVFRFFYYKVWIININFEGLLWGVNEVIYGIYLIVLYIVGI